MGAPTEYYCDPSIAGDSGAGTIGDPFGDLQYALNNITRDATNGDRINVKAGTDEVLAAGLSLTTYGTPSTAAPIILQGYTSAAGDGGEGGVDCGGSNGFWAATNNDNFALVDLHIHNGGSATLVSGDDFCYVFRLRLDNTTGGGISLDNYGAIDFCNIQNVGSTGISAGRASTTNNYLKNGTNKFTVGILLRSGTSCTCARNIISLDSTSIGIQIGDGNHTAANNSILSAGGTGTGIKIDNTYGTIVTSNLVEGFSGTGGIGISHGSGQEALIVESNALYNNTTNYSLSGALLITAGDNETLSASPFAKSGADTFANRFTYFAPVDTGNVIGGAFVG